MEYIFHFRVKPHGGAIPKTTGLGQQAVAKFDLALFWDVLNPCALSHPKAQSKVLL